jgi:adenylate kinase family enzyme
MNRLVKRGREDDSEEAMRRRFAGYHRDIHPVLEEFQLKHVPVVEVDARGDEEEVYLHIKQLLSEHS